MTGIALPASPEGTRITTALTVVGVGIGLLVATQPLPLAGALVGVAAFVVLALLTPLAALMVLLVLAPLRTLIATEAAYPFPLDIGQLALLAFLGSWALYRIARREPLLRLAPPAVVLPVAGFLVAGGLTAFNAVSLAAWLNEWLKWAQIVLLIVILYNSGLRWEWLVFGLTVAGAANALIGWYQFFGGSGALHLLVENRFFRAFGTFGQPNPFGGFMGLTAPLALLTGVGYLHHLWLLRRLHPPSVALAVFYLAAGALIASGVFISWSRGAWLAFAAALLVAAFALPRRWWQSLTLLLCLCAVIAILWFTERLPASITARINSATEEFFAFDDVRGVDITAENYAVVERLAHWQAALNMARSHFWLGVGLGNYENAYPEHRLINCDMALGHAHNYYLNILAETGMIGLTVYIAFLCTIVVMTWRARQHPDVVARGAACGLLGAWVYLVVHSITDNLYVNNVFLHIGVMLGLLALLTKPNQIRLRGR